MTFKTSYGKINPALNLFKQSLKKNTGVSVIIGIIAFIACPVFGALTLANFSLEQHGFSLFGTGYYFEEEGEQLLNLNPYALVGFVIVSLLAILTALILTITNFNYLYQRQSGDLFYALPLSRTEMFLSRFFSVYVSSLFVTVLPYVGLSFLSFFKDVNLDVLTIWKTFGVSTVMLFVTCAFFALFAVISGGIFNFLVAGVTYCATVLTAGTAVTVWLSDFTLGLNSLDTIFYGQWLNKLVRAIPFADYIVQLFRINPQIKGLSSYGVGKELSSGNATLNYFLFDILLYLLIGIVLLLIALFAYRKRKNEKVGESYVFGFIKACVCVCVGFVTAVILGSFFSIFDETSYSLFFWVFAAVGAFLGSTGTFAIISKGFKKFWKGIIAGALAFLILLSLFLGIKAAAKSDTVFVPSAEKVQKATLSVGALDLDLETEEILKLHQAIVDSIKEDKVYKNVDTYVSSEAKKDRDLISPLYSGDTENPISIINFYFSYKLKSGKEISRNYKVDWFWNLPLLTSVMYSDRIINQLEKADMGDTVNIITVHSPLGNYLPNEFSREDFLEFYRLLSEEFKTYKGEIDKEKALTFNVTFDIARYEERFRYVELVIVVPAEFEKATAFLSEKAIEDEDLIEKQLRALTAYAPEVEFGGGDIIASEDLMPLFYAGCVFEGLPSSFWVNKETERLEVTVADFVYIIRNVCGKDTLGLEKELPNYDEATDRIIIEDYSKDEESFCKIDSITVRDDGMKEVDVTLLKEEKLVIVKRYVLSFMSSEYKGYVIDSIETLKT